MPNFKASSDAKVAAVGFQHCAESQVVAARNGFVSVGKKPFGVRCEDSEIREQGGGGVLQAGSGTNV